MNVDLARYRVRCPHGAERERLFHELWRLFPLDRPVYEELLESKSNWYTAEWYVLYDGDEIVSNTALMPLRIRLAGRAVDLVGVAAVATVEKYRRQGAARQLLQYCLGIVDQRRQPAVLFTDLPAVYQRQGFRAVPQHYFMTRAAEVTRCHNGYDCTYCGQLDPRQTQDLAVLYDQQYPGYDGKLVRDDEYWRMYRVLFNRYEKPSLILCRRDEQLCGYLRYERESDRIFIVELCCAPAAADVTGSLLRAAADYATEHRLPTVSFALPAAHFAWRLLRQKGIRVEPETGGERREVFMVRPAAEQGLGPFGQLQWPLADKF